MILSPHILAGAALALNVSNPIAGLGLAIASHYILDAVPHAEYSIGDFTGFLGGGSFVKALPAMIRIGIDGGGAILAAIGISTLLGYSPMLAFAGGVAGALPDALTVCALAFPSIGTLRRHQLFHQRMHCKAYVSGNAPKHFTQTVRIGAQMLVIFVAIASIVLARPGS